MLFFKGNSPHRLTHMLLKLAKTHPKRCKGFMVFGS